MSVRVFDLFCGAGGSSRGASLAGAEIVGGVDAWELAAKTFQINFPGARVWARRAETLDLGEVAAEVGKIDILLASPECADHSQAKRRCLRREAGKDMAFEVLRYAAALQPRLVAVENVPRMASWPRFQNWLTGLQELGYHTSHAVIDAAEYGVPQSRKRLFVMGRQGGPAPTMPPASYGPKQTAASILRGDNGGLWQFRPVRVAISSRNTLERIEKATRELGPKAEFIVVYYSSDGSGYQPIERPLRTVTTVDRFALVRPGSSEPEIRMLQPEELAAAMGFPSGHIWPSCSRRDWIRLIGNAVCPPVMRAVVRHLAT